MIRVFSLWRMGSCVPYAYVKAHGARTEQQGAEMPKYASTRRLHVICAILERRLKTFSPSRLILLYFAFQKIEMLFGKRVVSEKFS